MGRALILRVFVILIISLMLVPVFLYSDQEGIIKASQDRNYQTCNSINHRYYLRKCVEEVYRLREQGCERLSEEEMAMDCFENIAHERRNFEAQSSTRFNFSLGQHNTPIRFFGLIFLFFALFKGPLVNLLPPYKRFIEGVLDVLPQSEYLAGVPLWKLGAVLFGMLMFVVCSIELLYFLS